MPAPDPSMVREKLDAPPVSRIGYSWRGMPSFDSVFSMQSWPISISPTFAAAYEESSTWRTRKPTPASLDGCTCDIVVSSLLSKYMVYTILENYLFAARFKHKILNLKTIIVIHGVHVQQMCRNCWGTRIPEYLNIRLPQNRTAQLKTRLVYHLQRSM